MTCRLLELTKRKDKSAYLERALVDAAVLTCTSLHQNALNGIPNVFMQKSLQGRWRNCLPCIRADTIVGAPQTVLVWRRVHLLHPREQ